MAGPDLSEFHDLLEEELNVEAIQAEVIWTASSASCSRRTSAPSHLRQAVNDIANAIKNAEDPEAMLAEINAGSCTIEGVAITPEDVEVRRTEREASRP